MFIQYLLKAFTEAWSQIWDIPAPRFKVEDEKLNAVVLSRVTMFMFPLLGLLVGAVLMALGGVLASIPGRRVEILLFSLIAAVLTEVLSGGRGLSYLSGFLELITQRNGVLRSLLEAPSDINSERGPAGLAFMFTALLLRTACFGIIFSSGGTYWLMVVFALSYTLQLQLGTMESLATGKPFVKGDSATVMVVWTFAALLILCMGGSAVAALVALAISGAAAFGAHKLFERYFKGISAAAIGGIAYALEIVLLLIGAGVLEQ